jgi:hypothetical protein
MINLGIVGLGPVWESRYRPVLDKLQHRVRIRAVFDPVANRCDEVAATLRAAPYQGVLALLTHADVRGILLLDTSWHGNALIHFLRHARKPVYIAGSLGENWDELSRLRSLVESEGLLVMPEFSRRFTPATCRLHELIATRLGRPRHIAIDAVPPAPGSPDAIPGQKAGTDFLVGLLDWCRYVVRSTTIRLEARPLDPDSTQNRPQHRVAIEFADGREHGPQRSTAELLVRHPDQPGDEAKPDRSRLSFTILCGRSGTDPLEGDRGRNGDRIADRRPVGSGSHDRSLLSAARRWPNPNRRHFRRLPLPALGACRQAKPGDLCPNSSQWRLRLSWRPDVLRPAEWPGFLEIVGILLSSNDLR